MSGDRRRVLVFPAGSEIGLEIVRSVAGSTHFDVVGATSVDDHSTYALHEVWPLPPVGDSEFIADLARLVTEADIDVIYPAHDDVALAVAEAVSDGRLHTRAVVSAALTHRICRAKSLTYESLSGLVRVPAGFPSVHHVTTADLPVFAKPDRGQGSKGAVPITTPAELAAQQASGRELLVSEFLPGREYTVDCFTDRRGELRYARGRSRDRILNGIAARSGWVENPGFWDIAVTINDRLDLRGGWFFQLKEDADARLTLLEIAPRIAGTMGLSRCSGVNIPLLSLFDRFDGEVHVAGPDPSPVGEVDRSLSSSYRVDITYSQVFIDLDDFLLVRGQLHLPAVEFVFQCVNRGVAVHLITKHEGDLAATLTRSRLSGVFDSVTHLERGDDKWRHVATEDAIFLDDSFSEREQVRRHCRIPVFDLQSLPALIDGRTR